MKTPAIKLWALAIFWLSFVASAVENTNAPINEERTVRVGSIVINNGYHPAESIKEQTDSSVASEWVIPILKIIAWPGLVAVLVYLFRKEIKSKVKTVSTVKGGEHVAVEFSPDTRDQQNVPAHNPSSPEIANGNEEFHKLKAQAETSLAVVNLASQIRQNLAKTNLTEQQKIELGALTVAQLRLEAFFWRAYTLIFGTQIALLYELNARNLTEQEIQTYVSSVKEKFPEAYATWSHHTYIEFLKNFEMIQVAGGVFSITEYGKEFLIWIARNQLSPNKNL